MQRDFLSAHVRHQTLGTPGPRSQKRLPVDAVLIRQLIGQISHVGNNFNQIVRLAHLGDLPANHDFEPTMRRINEILDACLEALGKEP